jgi:hypothetical protein
MQIRTAIPLVDAILTAHDDDFAGAPDPYRNHVYRVLHYYAALTGETGELPTSVLIAAAYHDLGIWSDRTFDYLPPSIARARAYLETTDRGELVPEVDALIAEHHKLRAYRGPQSRDVELFRRADLVDVSVGLIRFGVPSSTIRAVKAAFPDLGFHGRLVSLAARQLVKSPLRPLPMVRW